MAQLCMIAAVARNGVIGNNGTIPWYLREDFSYFKRVTYGYPCIMGRLTYASIGRALPGRKCIVVSSTLDHLPDAEVVPNLERAIAVASLDLPERVFVIGGESLYTEAESLADTLMLTVIDHDFEGDTFFPGYLDGKPSNQWDLESSVAKTNSGPPDSPVDFKFNVYTRQP